MPVESIHVSNWHRERDGKGEPEQVHLHFEYANQLPDILLNFINATRKVPSSVLRLKSREACDAIIIALQNHRDEVFPEE